MVSMMAIEDIENLQEHGYKLSPRDIIRLNAFGCRVEHNQESCKSFIMQRCAILGDIVFREPTVGHNIFMAKATSSFDIDDFDRLFFDSWVLSRKAEELPEPTDKNAIVSGVNEFVKSLSRFTPYQILNALEYVRYGNDCSEDELPIGKQTQNEDNDMIDFSDFSVDYGYIKDGIAIGLGLSVNEMKKLTRSELRRVLDENWNYKCVCNGLQVKSKTKDKYESEYWAELDRIKKSHTEDLTNG